MMTDEADVRVALHGATAHLAPRPGLLEDVRRGGRARQRRRRVGMAAGAVAVAAAVAVVSIAVPWHRPPTPGRVAATPSAEALIDARYAVEVIAAWKASPGSCGPATRRPAGRPS